MRQLNVYGPPGAGKTTYLTKLFVKAAERVGPRRVGAVTYTRAAAAELRARVADALDLSGDLTKEIPWVGTVHSLAYKLTGRKQLASLDDAREALGGRRLQIRFVDADGSSGEYNDNSSWDEISLALRLESSARHRRQVPYDALGTLSSEALAKTSPDRLLKLIDQYRAWKKDTHKIDYEDLLSLGAKHGLPVKAMFLDEAQDASGLLWHVVESWMSGTELSVCVGDPYQAIHVYMGANPELFRNRPGEWRSLGKSHRLTPASVAYAKRILTKAGWQDELIDTWRGVGTGIERDGTSFYLARTHKDVARWSKRLIDQGVPFRQLSGKAPLEQQHLDAWLADSTKRNPWGDYYRRVDRLHGSQGLCDTPKIALGVIHQAKGLEADHVRVLNSWGYLPGQSLSGTKKEMLEEACVAFVAASRHRVSLTIEDDPMSIARYPFEGGRPR